MTGERYLAGAGIYPFQNTFWTAVVSLVPKSMNTGDKADGI